MSKPLAVDKARSVLAGFPPGVGYAFGFAIFNGLSSQIILGSPLILYAKALGAGATVLGIVAGMMPLLTMFQMPAAQYLVRTGYKPFMLRGWNGRTAFIFVLMLIPWSAVFLDATTRMALVLTVLFIYNLLRGISSCAWLPWVAELVPAELRGRYLTAEQMCVNVAGAGAFGLAAAVLGSNPSEWRYGVVFAFSAVMAVLSLRFLKRIPDVPISEHEARTAGTVPWKELAAYPPFRRVLELNVAWAIAFGGLQTFIVAFLRTRGHLGDGLVLFAMAMYFLGGLASGWVGGERLDRLGSRPVLRFTMVMSALIALGWLLQAGGVIRPSFSLAVFLLLLLGLANALFNAAQNRLAMLTIPTMGRGHFLALFSVVLNVALGVAPVGWGILIDAIGARQIPGWGVMWTQFSVFFGLVAVAFVVAHRVAGGIDEKAASRTDALVRELLIHEPRRFLTRFWLR